MIVRKYIRHPANIPIEYRIIGNTKQDNDFTKDISVGGLCFQSHSCVDNNVSLSIQIPVTRPIFTVEGKVVWCSRYQDYVEIGVEFFKPGDIFKTRMVEQICQIVHYQNKILTEDGRSLSAEEAALEWIKQFGAHFPQI